MPDTKLNIYQKLIEVRKTVEYLKKDTQGQQFKFVSSSQTLGSLRKAMDKQGLLLIPSIVGKETRDHSTQKENHEYFTILYMKYIWINADNPEETITCYWTGQGLDPGEKGVGKALTYAEKYFMLKFFNIATDKDDPDNFQKRLDGETVTPDTKPQSKPANTKGCKNHQDGKTYTLKKFTEKDNTVWYGHKYPDKEGVWQTCKCSQEDYETTLEKKPESSVKTGKEIYDENKAKEKGCELCGEKGIELSFLEGKGMICQPCYSDINDNSDPSEAPGSGQD